MDATVNWGDTTLTYEVGEDGVTQVFGGDKGELVILRGDKITRIYNCQFTVTNARKNKDIEA